MLLTSMVHRLFSLPPSLSGLTTESDCVGVARVGTNMGVKAHPCACMQDDVIIFLCANLLIDHKDGVLFCRGWEAILSGTTVVIALLCLAC